MKKVEATLKNIPLTLHLAESKDEKTAGYNSVPICDGEGMLFRFEKPCWIPLDVSGLDGKLDAVFFINGAVNHILQRMRDQGAIHSGYGDAALELPGGFVAKHGIVLSDRLEIEGMVFTVEQKVNGGAESEPPQFKPEPKIDSGKRKR